jgi:hypothetical protein
MTEREAVARALWIVTNNLDAIIVRCEQGDKATDWLPIIARLAREARDAFASGTLVHAESLTATEKLVRIATPGVRVRQGDREALPPCDFIEGPDWTFDERAFAQFVLEQRRIGADRRHPRRPQGEAAVSREPDPLTAEELRSAIEQFMPLATALRALATLDAARAGQGAEPDRFPRDHELFAAHAILARPNADPDDDAAIVARAFLRTAARAGQGAEPGLREARITMVCDLLWENGVYMKDSQPLAAAIVDALAERPGLWEAAQAVVDAVAAWHLPTTVGGPRLSQALIALRAALAERPETEG